MGKSFYRDEIGSEMTEIRHFEVLDRGQGQIAERLGWTMSSSNREYSTEFGISLHGFMHGKSYDVVSYATEASISAQEKQITKAAWSP